VRIQVKAFEELEKDKSVMQTLEKSLKKLEFSRELKKIAKNGNWRNYWMSSRQNSKVNSLRIFLEFQQV
jgi:hypothetical protein